MLITIFSFLNVIILINLLVAILNAVYGKIKSQSSLEISESVYSLYCKLKFDKYYCSLSAFPAPFNIAVLPFVPFIAFLKNKKL